MHPARPPARARAPGTGDLVTSGHGDGERADDAATRVPRRSPAAGVAGAVDRAAVGLLTLLVRAYQRVVSPLLGKNCRYEPTCSEYFIGAVRRHGALRGSVRGVWRICRCHPWSRGGFDPP